MIFRAAVDGILSDETDTLTKVDAFRSISSYLAPFVVDLLTNREITFVQSKDIKSQIKLYLHIESDRKKCVRKICTSPIVGQYKIYSSEEQAQVRLLRGRDRDGGFLSSDYDRVLFVGRVDRLCKYSVLQRDRNTKADYRRRVELKEKQELLHLYLQCLY